MNKEKYIIARRSKRKGHEREITAYIVFLPLPNGTKYNKNFPVKDYKTVGACRRAAIKERDEILGKLAANKNVLAKKAIPSVDELFAKVPDLYKRRKSSLLKYQKEYSKWIKPNYGSKPITDITKLDVASTLNNCAEKCTRQQVSNIKSIWKKIYGVAIDALDIPVKDCSRVEMPPCDRVSKRSQLEQNITQAVFLEFCDYAASYGHYKPSEKALIYFRDIVLYALKLSRLIGVRPMEVRAIYRDCIEFMSLSYKDSSTGEMKQVAGARIAIIRSVGSSVTDTVTVRKTKTQSSPRYVYVGEDGAKLLKDILAYSKYDLVFADYNGNPISSTRYSDFMNRMKHKWWKDTGHHEEIYAELMRKSLAADNYRNGINPTITKQQMGHKSEDMSQNWYATVPDADVVNASLNRRYKD